VEIRIAADRPTGALKPILRFLGADEPNYSIAPNGPKLLGELGEPLP
jgi:hypothetical protein